MDNTCGSCNRPVVSGNFMKAIGKIYHQDCFNCFGCKIPLTGGFYELNGKVYCERDYDRLSTPICERCSNPVSGKVIKDDRGGSYHHSCFTCYGCNIQLTTSFFWKDNEAHCQDCSKKTQASLKLEIGVDKCLKCNRPISSGEATVKVGDRKVVHQQCLTCNVCNNSIPSGFSFYDDKFACKNCVDSGRVQGCFTCKNVIFGNKISAIQRFYHEDCFRCAGCSNLIPPTLNFFVSRTQEPVCGLCNALGV